MRSRKRPVILIGGGSYGGKSFGLRAAHIIWHQYLHSLGLRDIQTVIFADTIPNVRDRFHSKFEAEYGKTGTIMKGLGEVRAGGPSGYAFYFRNKSMGAIWLRSWEHDPFALRGKELAMVSYDESTQAKATYNSESTIQLLRIGARFAGSPNFPVVLASNWDGPGLGWHRKMFFEKSDTYGVDPDDVIYIKMLIDDNLNTEMVESYKPTLEALTGVLRDSRLLGIPTIPQGAAFPMADQDVQGFNIFERFPHGIPSDWVRILGVDWGFAAPFSAVWTAIEPGGKNAYTYRELYSAHVLDSEQAEMILQHTGQNERISTVYCDPAMWQSRTNTSTGSKGLSPVDAYRKVLLGDNRIGRIVGGDNRSRILNFGYLRQGLSRHSGSPWTWHISRSCSWLWSELQSAIFDTTNGRVTEDLDPRSDDHALTASAYSLRTHLDRQAKISGVTAFGELSTVSRDDGYYAPRPRRQPVAKWDIG